MLDVGSSWFEVRDTKAGIRSAEKFISALLTGRKLNMPYWFSASRAPGETNRALCKQRARAHKRTQGPVLIFDPPYLFARFIFRDARTSVWRCTRLDNNKRQESLYRVNVQPIWERERLGIETFVEQKLIVFNFFSPRCSITDFRAQRTCDLLSLNISKIFRSDEKSWNHLAFEKNIPEKINK